MKIILNRSSAEITVKKSRFIADVSPVVTAQEAYDFLAKVKKKYWDARHNCHAFVVGQDGETAHSSDDGEPQGTAGKPILQVLTGSGVSNCLKLPISKWGLFLENSIKTGSQIQVQAV